VQAKDTTYVTDSVTNSASLTKSTEPLLTTAQSITVHPAIRTERRSSDDAAGYAAECAGDQPGSR
jgi:hypothetical protein